MHFKIDLPDELRAELEAVLLPEETKSAVILAGLRQVIAARKQQHMSHELAAKIAELESRIERLEEED